jgi:hypothetical protein
MVLAFSAAVNLQAQVRYGNCKSSTTYDRFYITPYGGIGFAKFSADSLADKESRFTYFGGLTAVYGFDKFRIGIGARFQPYTKNDDYGAYIKPYVAMEIPLYFDEFADFGITANAGALFPTGSSIPQSGYFFDIGLYYNLVITSTSGLFFGTNYSYNSININPNSNSIKLNVSEFDLIIGYRMWF